MDRYTEREEVTVRAQSRRRPTVVALSSDHRHTIPRIARSEQELQTAASQVGSELVQLCAMPGARRRADEAGQDRVARACLDSMLLHARNLGEFLIEGRYKTTDIHRSDFAPRWSPPNSASKKRLRDVRPVLDRHLSHLTWEHVGVGTLDHDPTRIADDIVEMMGTFVDHLETEANPAAQWFDSDLRLARMLLDGNQVDDVPVVSSAESAVTQPPSARAGTLWSSIRELLSPAPTAAAALRVARPAVGLVGRASGLLTSALSRLAAPVVRHWEDR